MILGVGIASADAGVGAGADDDVEAMLSVDGDEGFVLFGGDADLEGFSLSFFFDFLLGDCWWGSSDLRFRESLAAFAAFFAFASSSMRSASRSCNNSSISRVTLTKRSL